MTQCYACKNQNFVIEYLEKTREVDGHQFTAILPIQKCTTCGEFLFPAESLYQFELAIAHQLAESGTHSGKTFRFMRKAIGISARELAHLLDTTPETISRWETNKRDIDHSALAILGTLVLDEIKGHTDTLKRLENLRTHKPLAKSIRVSLHAA